jgi:ABC-type antimicrobial peptide transport system permease subunit
MTDGLNLTPGRFTTQGDQKAHMARFLANTDSSLHEYFYLRSFTLTEGRHITPDDRFAAVVSNVLALTNSLSVGDTFSASYVPDALPDDIGDKQTQFDFTVVGIYEIASPQTDDINRAECDIQENFIFTDTASFRAMYENLSGSTSTVYSSGVTFFVEDPREMGALVAHLADIPGYDWDGFKIIQNNKAYNDSAVPLERMSGLILTFLVIIGVVSVVMLSLGLVMWMKDRKYEIGILMSVGIRKAGIITQHIVENLFIAVVAFLLAWGVSGIAADRVGGALLGGIVGEAEASAGEQHADLQIDYDPGVVQAVEPEDVLAIQVGIMEVLMIVGIGFAIIVLSTGLSSIMVLRMKPKEILSSYS